MNKPKPTFYVVWSQQAGPPRVRHKDYYSAIREAERLAALAPETSYFVLAAVSETVCQNVQTDRFLIPDDVADPESIPF